MIWIPSCVKTKHFLATLVHQGWLLRVWAEVVGGGETTLCIKIGYSEPRRVFHLSRELSCDVMLDSDWLTTRVTYYSILIGCRGCSILIGWRLGWLNTRFWLAAESRGCSILIGWRLGWLNTRLWLAAESRECSILIGCREPRVLDSDWPPRSEGSRVLLAAETSRVGSQCNKIWSREPKADSMY